MTLPEQIVRAAIAGTGVALPEAELTNAQLEARLDTTDDWIMSRTGIRSRRVAADGETTASLATAACADAIKSADLTPDDIDLLVVATATPEQPIPHTGAFVGHELGLHCGSFDVGAGCAGFVAALIASAGIIASGASQRALVVGSETLSRIVDPDDRSTCVLFGDGAGAVVLEASPDEGPGILASDLGCDGSAAGLLEVQAGGSRLPTSAETVADRQHYLRMNGQEVFRRAVHAVVNSSEVTLDRAGVQTSEVAWFVPHQANTRIIEAAAKRLGIGSDRTVVNIDRYGNTSAASIPVALHELSERGSIDDDSLVLCSGFGAGMTWASAVIRWGRP